MFLLRQVLNRPAETLIFQTFSAFVLSLSWQMVGFNAKMTQKAFFHRSVSLRFNADRDIDRCSLAFSC
jgi:hypothetical protein